MAAPTTSPTATDSRARLLGLDGLRGLAIVLVVVSHTWTLTEMPEGGVGRVLMTSGNFAVAFFFVIGGFLATRAMLREVERRGQVRPAMFFIRRWLRISAQVYPLVVFVLVLTAIDKNMDSYSQNDTRESAWRIITYTWNDYILTHSMLARPDLGHLWYVCTDLWVIGVIALAVFLLRGRRVPLAILFTLGIIAVYIFRRHVFQTDGEAHALVRLQTRADGLFWGALAAVALPWCRSLLPSGRTIGLLCFLALIPLAWGVNGEGFFTIWNPVLGLVLAVLVITIAQGASPLGVGPILESRPLVLLGEYSFAIYVWHYPVFWYIARNYLEWSAWQKVVAGYLVTAMLALIVQRLIERPTVRWLGSDGWRPFDNGLLPGLWTLLRARLERLRPQRLRERAAAGPDVTELEVEDIAAGVDGPARPRGQ